LLEFVVAVARRCKDKIEDNDLCAGIAELFNELRPNGARPREIFCSNASAGSAFNSSALNSEL